ncbi:MAG: GNAT family N-acetyltransferase [Clostridia bacterium]|nr:GNAT family N-acetyltransferase [Clostridia bacterium]
MIIRKMHRDDLPACAQILQSVYNNELWQARWTQETAEAYLADIFDMKKFVGYVAEDQGELIGAIFAREKVWWNNSEILVEEMFVKPDMQGKGCGTLLMRQIEAYVREHALAGITLSTNRYAPAPEFYRRLGFTDCGHVLFMAKEMQ